MGKIVSVVDYGVGNLHSVSRALQHVGADVTVTGSKKEIEVAEYLVLPGVGAFAQAMKRLHELKLIESIIQHVQAERPFLGICLGMQLMLEFSEEHGENDGLCIIPGRVSQIPNTGKDGNRLKVPFVGWASLNPADDRGWNGTILKELVSGDFAYFIHSYRAMPTDKSDLIAQVDYNGVTIPAVVQRGNAFGCQFHPEKSGPAGLSILKQFINL